MVTLYKYHKDGTLPPVDSKYIFVFGSNLRGIHGAGAALVARHKYGAEYGVGAGITGSSYAIPTKDKNIKTLDLDTISHYVGLFKEYTLEHLELKFWVSGVGCGLAGYSPLDIAPLFKGCSANCNFPENWFRFLETEGV